MSFWEVVLAVIVAIEARDVGHLDNEGVAMSKIGERAQARLLKLHSMAKHFHYGRLCQRITESEFDTVVEFIEDYGDLDDSEFARLVLQYGIDMIKKPKNLGIMADILLSCKDRTPFTGEEEFNG